MICPPCDRCDRWRRRLHHMAQYFHAYRIDHVLGFFRIWEIPGDCVTGGEMQQLGDRILQLQNRGEWRTRWSAGDVQG